MSGALKDDGTHRCILVFPCTCFEDQKRHCRNWQKIDPRSNFAYRGDDSVAEDTLEFYENQDDWGGNHD